LVPEVLAGGNDLVKFWNCTPPVKERLTSSIGLKTTADVQLYLMEQETLSTGETGQTSWIATGLKIEETQ
jgi:hypothetical protein